jgi:DNA invertase Pin-like site-specific DNA recombinase
MTTILLAFAEFERDMIVERTTAGKAVAKANDPEWSEGRKRIEIPEFEKFLKKQKEGLLTVAECCKQLGISRSTWNRRARESA